MFVSMHRPAHALDSGTRKLASGARRPELGIFEVVGGLMSEVLLERRSAHSRELHRIMTHAATERGRCVHGSVSEDVCVPL